MHRKLAQVDAAGASDEFSGESDREWLPKQECEITLSLGGDSSS
jgi:hypothetical protein